MTSHDHVTRVIGEFGAAIGLPAVGLDADGRTTLSVGAIDISLLYEETPTGMLWLLADLGPLPADDEAAGFLLRLNFPAWISDSMTLAVDGAGDGEYVLGFTAVPRALLDRAALEHAFRRLARAGLAVAARLAARDYTAFDSVAVPEGDVASSMGDAMKV